MTQFQIQCNNISEQRQKRIELLSESSSFSPADPPFQGQINNPFPRRKQKNRPYFYEDEIISVKSSEPGLIPVTSRFSRALVQAT